MTRITVETEGIEETLAAVKRLDQDLRKEANAEIRQAAKRAAQELVNELRASAAASGVPVAARVAGSARVKSDRTPTVVVGGPKRVGRRGAPAAALVWGSETGGRNFAAPAGGSYWIAPAVDRFAASRAVPIFKDALGAIISRYGLGG